ENTKLSRRRCDAGGSTHLQSSSVPVLARGTALLVTQGLDGVQAGRLPRRIKTEEDSDRPGKTKGNEDRVRLDQEVPLGGVGDAISTGQTDADPDQTFDEGQADGFHQELAEDVSSRGAHRHPETDFRT